MGVKNNAHFDRRLWPYALPGVFIVVLLWLIQWAQYLFAIPFYRFGILPQTLEGIKGIFFMPLIHDKYNLHHIINNSIAFFLLSTLLAYAYRKLFLPVLVLSWVGCGFFLWLFAKNHGAYHIGISGVIYALFSFLFVSGIIRRYFPLQAMSFLVVFLYGSLVWGIFPMDQHISWEGHLAGFLSGIMLAILYRKQGPVRPKYQYEVEQELGIDPPDLEGEWLRRMQEAEEKADPLIINYHYTSAQPNSAKPPDDNTNAQSPSQGRATQDPNHETPQ